MQTGLPTQQRCLIGQLEIETIRLLDREVLRTDIRDELDLREQFSGNVTGVVIDHRAAVVHKGNAGSKPAEHGGIVDDTLDQLGTRIGNIERLEVRHRHAVIL